MVEPARPTSSIQCRSSTTRNTGPSRTVSRKSTTTSWVRATELRVDGVDLGRVGHLGPERYGKQRQPSHEVGCGLLDDLLEQFTGMNRVGIDVDARTNTQQRTKDAVGRRCAVRRARPLEQLESLRRAVGGIEQARLTDSRCAAQDDDLAELADGVGEDIDFAR